MKALGCVFKRYITWLFVGVKAALHDWPNRSIHCIQIAACTRILHWAMSGCPGFDLAKPIGLARTASF